MIKNVKASLIVWLKARVQQSRDISPDLAFVDLDAHASADQAELPTTDLVGLFGLGLENRGGIKGGDLGVAVMTVDDAGLYRHVEVMDRLMRDLEPGANIPLLDASTGQKVGWLAILEDVYVSPMGKTEIRPLQFIQTSFRMSPLAG